MKNDDRFDNTKKESKLSADELDMLRTRYEQLDDRSNIPPPTKKQPPKVIKLVKQNKIASAVGAIFILALTVCIVLISVYATNFGNLKNKKDYTFYFGKQEIKQKYEKIVIDNVLYVDMNRLAVYAELSVSGSSDTMKYIASDGQYIKFTNESEFAIINGAKVVIPAPAFVDTQKCIVPYSVISRAIENGISFETNDKKRTVTITRQTYERDDIVYFKDVTFTTADFKVVAAIKDTSSVAYNYGVDVSKYLKYIDPADNSEYLMLVNPSNPLGKEYVPSGLSKLPSRFTSIGEDYYLSECAAQALTAMLTDMPNYQVYVTSAYRDYSYQQSIFEQYVKKYTNMGYTREEAQAKVLQTSALPGTSEHQSGLCVDLMTTDMTTLDNSFESTHAYKWLSENAYKYGFILRYPKDKTDITSYNYESWHYRFVGRDAATKIHFSGLCLEEYLELI